MDARIVKAMADWSAWEIYNGKKVIIPDVTLLYYFEYLPSDKPVDQWEKQAYLAVGWKGYDMEAIIALGIFGSAATDNTNVVDVEITRLGGAEMHILKDGVERVKFPAYIKGIAKGYIGFPMVV